MSGYRLLVVDHDELSRRNLREHLTEKGYVVQEADSGIECIRSCQAAPPNAILMECSLPDTQGVHLLRRLREINFTIPVIMMTAHPSVELTVRAAKDGAERLIAKPADATAVESFLEEVHAAVRSKHALP